MKSVLLKGIRCVRQRDGHGCGYCACAAVYRYYGLDTRRLRLRERLGTDNHFLPYLMPMRDKVQALMDRLGLDDKGTLCPDMFAALYGDGFDSAYVAGAYDGYRNALRRHLLAGHPALVLVGGMTHWIVVAGMDDSGVLVLDSSGYCDPNDDGRFRLQIKLTHAEFGVTVCGIVFVRRGKRARPRPMTALDFAREYARGAALFLACLGRSVPHWLGLRAG